MNEFSLDIKENVKVARRHQLMQVLCRYPRITVGEVGRKSGLSKTYCYNLLQAMEYRGLVSKERRIVNGQESVKYQTAFDAIVSGGAHVLELSHGEHEAMKQAAERGMKAAEWYGYSRGEELVAAQLVLF